MSYRLVIGNKNTSSWSMRPWLAMRHAGLPFSEVNINLRDADAKAQILAKSPSGKVPALLAGDSVIWDSLAIIEFLAEAHPEAGLWPAAREVRAQARCVSAEMHSGFQPLRQHCPMHLTARSPASTLLDEVAADVRRIIAVWGDCRRRFGAGGPFLFGAFSAADAMYAPVASRFRTYVPSLDAYGDDGTAQAYVDALFALPAMIDWERGAREEIAARA
jgi:glutathione S-transferase